MIIKLQLCLWLTLDEIDGVDLRDQLLEEVAMPLREHTYQKQ